MKIMKTIRAKILVISLIAALLFCSVIIWLTLNASERYRALITADCSYAVNSEFEFISDRLETYGEQAEDLARLGSVYFNMNKRSVVIDRSIITDNLNFQHNFIGGGIWFEPYVFFPDEERHCIYVFKDGGGNIIYDISFEGEEYDYPRQGWYEEIAGQLRAGNDVAWFGPYEDEAGSYANMMTVGAGIYNDGVLVGIATADLSIDFMLEMLSELAFTPGTYISETNYAGELLGETHARGKYGEEIEFSRQFVNGGTISVAIPASELFKEVNTMIRRMAIIVFIIVLASFIVIYGMLDRLLNRPLAALTEKTKEIGKGNLDVAIEVKNDDEIGQLGATINKMASDIKLHIENLNTVTRENERIRSELEIAAKIQREMLPVLEAEDSRYDIYAYMAPCREVGGDFYDAFIIGGDSLCVVIADVSGKGVPAALFMAKAKTAIRTFAEAGHCASEVLTKANVQLSTGNNERMFVTAFFGVLNLKTYEFTYVNAGHNKPLIMRHGESFEYLDTDSGLVLGILKSQVYNESSLLLNSGDRLFLYTDGITEAFNADREAFGEVRLKNILNGYTGDSINIMAEGLKGELAAFIDGAPTHDDVTLLCVELAI